MSNSAWKMVVDHDGMTITSDRFQLVTHGPGMDLVDTPSSVNPLAGDSRSADMETILSELQSMTRGTYRQFCGLSRAMEMIGERWALLIIRNLLVGPKQFAELQAGLPGISDAILSTRLKELERTGIVYNRMISRLPATATDLTFENLVVYDVTSYGRQLEEPLIHLGRWGAQSLGDPRPDDVITPDGLITALRSSYRAEAAQDLRAIFELRFPMGITVYARIERGTLRAGEGSQANPDLIIEPGMSFKDLLAGFITPDDAVDQEMIYITGERTLLNQFVEIFTLKPKYPS